MAVPAAMKGINPVQTKHRGLKHRGLRHRDDLTIQVAPTNQAGPMPGVDLAPIVMKE